MRVWNYYNLRWLSGYDFVSDAPYNLHLIIEKLAEAVAMGERGPSIEVTFDGSRYFCVLKSLVYVDRESRYANYIHAFVVENGLNQSLTYRKLGSVFLQVYGEDIQKVIEEIYSTLSHEEKSDKGRDFLRRFSIHKNNLLQAGDLPYSVEVIFHDLSGEISEGNIAKDVNYSDESQQPISSYFLESNKKPKISDIGLAEEVPITSELLQEVEHLKREIHLLKERGRLPISLNELLGDKERKDLVIIYVISTILLVFISTALVFLLNSLYGIHVSSLLSGGSESSSEVTQNLPSTTDCSSDESDEADEEFRVASRISNQMFIYKIDIERTLCPDTSSTVKFKWESPVDKEILAVNIGNFKGGGWGESSIKVGYASQKGGSILLYNPSLKNSRKLDFSMILVVTVSER